MLFRSEEEQSPGIMAMREAGRIAKEQGISDMSLEEINAEISMARRERKE